MHCTRLPFWTELSFGLLAEKIVALLRPEKAFTEDDSLVATLDEAAAKATGATTEEATADAMATETPD